MGAQERPNRSEEGAGLGMSQPLWGERPEGGGAVALWGQQGPWGHTQGKSPAGLRVPVVFLVLFLSAEIPPARQEEA